MDIAESIGFIQFWGVTPSFNILDPPLPENHILLSGNGDIRHLMRTLSENALTSNDFSVSFYIHETSKEVLSRNLFFIYLINDLSLSIKDRMELFLEIYGNCLIREKAAEYLTSASQELVKIVTNHKAASPVKDFFDFSALKFKDRDDLEEIFRSWNQGVDFDMVGLRDQRLRYHYKDRYDYQDNLSDWDYHWGYKEQAPTLSHRHYKSWRRTGVAYEYRLAPYNTANRTLSGYIPGKKKTTKDSVLVRGFWGDIVNSPYWAHGVEINCCQECAEVLNKIASVERVHHEGDVSEFNVTKIIRQMESFSEFHFPPEKDRMRAIQKYWKGEEVVSQPVAVIEEVHEELVVLPAFQRFRVKIVPVVEEIKSLAGKRKFQGLFTHAVVSGASSVEGLETLKQLIRHEGHLILETLTNLGIIKKEDREASTESLKSLATQANLQELSITSSRLTYQVNR